MKKIKLQESLSNEEYEKQLHKEIKKEKRKRIILWIIILLLCLLCFLFYFWGYRIGKLGYIDTSVNTTMEKSEVVIKVMQKNLDASVIKDLDIFKNSKFNNKKIIAPFSQGTYNFKIKNETKQNIQYNILMSEENNWDVNLKYRLKLDNVYIIGNSNTWVDIDKLNVLDIIVTDESENIYTIEWYWEEASNDTLIGKSQNAEYKLKINVEAKAYNGEV